MQTNTQIRTTVSWLLLYGGVVRCSLVEMKRLNDELTVQNDDKDRELERLNKALEDALSENKLAAAQKKIHALEERLMEVRYVS